MTKLLALALIAATALTGCGSVSPAGTLKLAAAPTVHRVSQKLELVAAPTVVLGDASQLVSAGTGAITMRFRTGAQAYGVLATAADIEKIVVTLKQDGFLLDKTVAVAEVPRANIASNRAIVNFNNCAPDDYRLGIVAYDAAGAKIGETSEDVTVVAGEVANVNARLQLVAGPAASGIGLNVDIVNGG